MKRKHSILISILVLGALSVIFALALLFLGPGPVDASEGKILVRVERGSSAADVAAILRDQGLIRNKALFQILLRATGTDKKLKAGTYRIEKGLSAASIVALLAEGKISQVQVTIPEGSTSRAIADILERAGICGAEEFMAAIADKDLALKLGIPGSSAEGYLFPDTYLFPEKSAAEEIVRALARNFFKKIASLAPAMAETPKALYDSVVLASIVEREYRVASEAGLIASVFKNRLRIGMPLQSCATVVYVITEKQGKPHPKVVYYSDLAIADPYNTYLHRGLPPGPISNPGETALKAVFNTPQSDYLYFRLADGATGSHKFSRTFDEHTGDSIPVKGF